VNIRAIDWKLGLFYISTIGLAIGLFQAVTQYGEAVLKPQPNITGIYRLKTATMPNCLQNSLLELAQSGRFINAVILPESELVKSPAPSAGKKAKPAHVGKPRSRQQGRFGGTFASEHPATAIVMTGNDRQVGKCFVTAIGINAQIKKGVISGQLQLNQPNPTGALPAAVLNQATYNNGNGQVLTFWAEKVK
jgi:hypothetical protein